MLELKNVTLVSVNCIKTIEPIIALKYSMKGINFGSVKFLTSENIQENFDLTDIELIKIPKLDYENYSRFLVYELYKYIETEFLLIIQDDGYVINPQCWKNEFFEYDYIGAPWALPPDNDKIGYRDAFGNIIRVGNGGFSLRSKKLMSLPDTLGLEWKSYFGFYNEDGYFTCHNRHILQKEGCKFADIEIAKYFSHETNLPELEGIEPFGFHGKWTKYVHLAYV